jgi:prepilin-type N-terminal cleavage/methylation domain-containing protein
LENPSVTRQPARPRAFSLIELLLVAAIAVVVAAIAVPRMASASDRHRVTSAAALTARTLAEMQDRARTTGVPHACVFTGEPDGIVTYTVTAAAKTELERFSLATAPQGAQLWRCRGKSYTGIYYDASGASTHDHELVVVVGETFQRVTIPTGLAQPTVHAPARWTTAEHASWERVGATAPVEIVPPAEQASVDAAIVNDAEAAERAKAQAQARGKKD